LLQPNLDRGYELPGMRRALAVVLWVLPMVAIAAPSLDRDLTHYTILGLRRVRLKNFAMEPPGCHVGVNCAQPDPNSACGQLNAKHAKFAGPGQLVADNVCATESFFEVFKNRPAGCGPDCTMITDAGPASDCTSPFTPPLVDDLDGDGNPSCSAACETDVDDIAAACGVVLPLPSCDPAHAIEALPNADCSAGDVVPGNGSCDLAAGTYGAIRVRNGARITFAAGTTIACSVKAGKATRLTSAGTARVVVSGAGSVKINNTSDGGSTCGALTFITERGPIVLGRNGDFAIDACALRGKLKLGHANNLHGHFVGADVVMDFNNDGRCCTPAPPPPTTSTSTSSSTSSTAPGGSTTSTTTPGGSSTSTTTPGSSSTSTTTPGASTTTSTPASSSTSTTMPAAGFTRTVGFYKTHPAVTASILADGALTVCGQLVIDVDIGHAHSALEIMCVTPRGDVRLQLARQLMAAALTRAAGGAPVDLGPCDAVCTNAAATDTDLASCVDTIDRYNQSGDALPASWGTPSAADPRPCDLAAVTPCTIVSPGDCTAP
jgi:hypothetical protein